MICNRPYRLLAGTMLLLSLAACKSESAAKKEAPKTGGPVSPVDVFVVSSREIDNQIDVPGTLMPNEATAIHTEVSGRVIGLYFKEGAPVAKGSLLLKLEDNDLQAQLKKLQVQLAIAQKTEERQKQLLAISGISQQDYDLSLLAVNNLRADIDIIKTSILKTEIRAPYSGTTGLRNISLGAYVSPATEITTIRDIGNLKLEFTVPERYGAAVAAGKNVQFSIDGSQQKWTARVLATENNIETETRSLRVRAVVNSTGGKLISGAFAKVQLLLDKNEAALMIPSQAIIPQAKNKKVVRLKDGLASMEVITTGIRDTAMVEITSGLKTGDTVLISGLLTTKPGSKVKIRSVKSH